jgi:hypothetical protein
MTPVHKLAATRLLGRVQADHGTASSIPSTSDAAAWRNYSDPGKEHCRDCWRKAGAGGRVNVGRCQLPGVDSVAI